MHVVDATGQSDKDGNVLGKGETGPSPCCLISVHRIVYMSFLFHLSSFLHTCNVRTSAR